MRSGFAILGFVLALTTTSTLAAQDETGDTSADQTSAEGSTEAGASIASDQSASEAKEPAASDKSAKAGTRRWSFGPYFRFVVVPSFMLKLFLDEAPSPANVGFGASATYRTESGSPNFDFGIGYTSYSFTGPFRTKGGNVDDTEIVQSDLGLVHLTGSILWEAPIADDKLSVQYGVGLDLGIVTGQLKRTEAYPNGNGGFAKCIGPGVPDPINCGAPQTPGGLAVGTDPYNKKGEQYNVVQKGLPPVMALPMLPRLGLRYAPIPDFWVRLDAAYGIAQFWIGLSAAYSPDL